MASLYIQTAFLGDLCLAVPALNKLRELDSEKKVFLICREGLGAFFESLGVVDRAFEVEKGSRSSYQKVKSEVGKFEFEYLVCAHQSIRSAQLAFALRAKQKIAYQEWWNGFFFKKRILRNPILPEALRQLSLLATVDLRLKEQLVEYLSKNGQQELRSFAPWASPELVKRHQEEVAKTALLFPGSVWATKRWTESGFAEVANWLTEQGYRVMLMGAAIEQELCQRIGKLCPKAEVLAGSLSIQQSFALISKASLVVSNDSGAQHLASLSGTPTVSIFGPTVVAQGFQPWNSRSAVVELGNLACRPCGRHGHQVCPLGTHECMQGLGAKKVCDTISTLLTSSQSNPLR